MSPEPTAASPGPVMSNLGERIQELLDDAERVAVQIRSEAEAAAANHDQQRRAEADRFFDERVRELGNISASLSARAEAVQRDASELVRELDDAMQRLARLSGGLVLAASSDGPDETGPLEPIAYPGTRGDNNRMPEQALLRATQMAVAGSERTEIERMLRVEFDIEDPISVVDEMLRSERA